MAHQYSVGDEPVPGSGYRLVEFLGRGGFGEVWKASAPGGAEAALKIIALGGREGRKEFRALQLVKRIRHPNLVPIFAFWLKGSDGSILDDSLAMKDDLPAAETAPLMRATLAVPSPLASVQASELIIAMGLGDRSLMDYLEACRAQGREGIPQEELLRYLKHAAEAIDFLNRPVHDLGSGPVAIQHCDIKPHNLMLVGGSAQVCDFGLARSMAADRTNTAAASIAYAAPECLEAGKPSATTDQYSLAVTYFELKTGRLPYTSETVAGILDAKIEETLDFTSLPEAEAAVLRRATAHDPSQRYASSLELVEALWQATLGPKPVPARRRSFALLCLVLLVPLVAIGAWVTSPSWLRKPPPPVDTPPEDPAAVAIQRAEGHVAQNEFGLAVDDYTEVLRLQPQDGKARLGRARCYLKLGQSDAAIADFQAAPDLAETRGELAAAYLQRADRRLEKQDFAAALQDYEAALQREPKLGRALLGRGRCHVQQQQPEAAIADLEQARQCMDTSADPAIREFAAAYWQRGCGRAKQQELDGAIVDFEEALRLDPQAAAGYRSRPEYAAAYLARGTEYLEQKAYQKALPDLERARQATPQDARIGSRLGAAWSGLKNYAKAVEALTAALDLEPNDLDYVSRGRARKELGQLDDAVADFTEAIRLNPNNAAAYASRGDLYMERDDVKHAIADFDQAIRIGTAGGPVNFPLPTAYILRASSQLIAGELDLAAKDFSEVLRIGKPEDLRTIDGLLETLAATYAEDGNTKEAVRWIKQAADLAPDDSTKQKYLAQLREYEAKKP
jgi:tetratricopeptide (TPR) repeat protein